MHTIPIICPSEHYLAKTDRLLWKSFDSQIGHIGHILEFSLHCRSRRSRRIRNRKLEHFNHAATRGTWTQCDDRPWVQQIRPISAPSSRSFRIAQWASLTIRRFVLPIQLGGLFRSSRAFDYLRILVTDHCRESGRIAWIPNFGTLEASSPEERLH